METTKKLQIGVMGPAVGEYPIDPETRKKVCEYAEKIGGLLARQGAVVFTGGMDGVMELAARGAKYENGTTVGTPGRARGRFE